MNEQRRLLNVSSEADFKEKMKKHFDEFHKYVSEQNTVHAIYAFADFGDNVGVFQVGAPSHMAALNGLIVDKLGGGLRDSRMYSLGKMALLFSVGMLVGMLVM